MGDGGRTAREDDSRQRDVLPRAHATRRVRKQTSPIPHPPSLFSYSSKQLRQVSVQLALEVLRQHARVGRRGGRRGAQALLELAEVELHQAEGAVAVEHRQKDERPARGRHVRQINLARATRVVQPAERLPLQLLPQLGRRRVDRRGEGAGGHHVHRPGEAVLGDDLAARVEQEREQYARVVHELLDRRLDPALDRGGGGRAHRVSAPIAFSISTRMSPTLALDSATVTSTRSSRPAAHTRPLGASSCRNAASPRPAARADSRALRKSDAASAATACPRTPIWRFESMMMPSDSDTTILPSTPRCRMSDASISLNGELTAAPPPTCARARPPARAAAARTPAASPDRRRPAPAHPPAAASWPPWPRPSRTRSSSSRRAGDGGPRGSPRRSRR